MSVVDLPTLRPLTTRLAPTRKTNRGWRMKYIATTSTLDRFMRFETNGMSCRRMSWPPSVICCVKDTGT